MRKAEAPRVERPTAPPDGNNKRASAVAAMRSAFAAVLGLALEADMKGIRAANRRVVVRSVAREERPSAR